MSREIKFRAWDKEQNKMVSHEQIDSMDKNGVAHWMDIIKPDNKDGFDVMQATGLFDKDSKEIYEGDYVRTFGYFPSFVHEVEFYEGAFGWWSHKEETFRDFISFECNINFRWDEHHSQEIEVMGNVYETSESDIIEKLKTLQKTNE